MTNIAFAEKYAITISPKTIIFADQELRHPIGYFPIGKRIMIGEREYAKETVLSSVYAGKLVYVQAYDLELWDKGTRDLSDRHQRYHSWAKSED